MRIVTLVLLSAMSLFSSCSESNSERHIREAKEKVRPANSIRDQYVTQHPEVLQFHSEDGSSLSDNFTLQIQNRILARPDQRYWIDHDDFDLHRASDGILLIIKSEGSDWIYVHCTDKQAEEITRWKKGTNIPRGLFVFALKSASPLRAELVSEGDSENRFVIASGLSGHIYSGVLTDLLLLDDGN